MSASRACWQLSVSEHMFPLLLTVIVFAVPSNDLPTGGKSFVEALLECDARNQPILVVIKENSSGLMYEEIANFDFPEESMVKSKNTICFEF